MSIPISRSATQTASVVWETVRWPSLVSVVASVKGTRASQGPFLKMWRGRSEKRKMSSQRPILTPTRDYFSSMKYVVL